jgi:lactoylglutathione lyase
VRVQLGGVAINVTDLARSVAFYRQVFDMEELHRIELPDATEVIVGGAGGASLMLVHHRDRDPAAGIPPGAVDKLYFTTSDATALFARAVGHGAEAVAEPVRGERFNVTFGFVNDPDGHRIELVEPDGGTGG